MNQFRRSCEAAAAAAGGCLFPRCISACAEFAGVRRTSHSSTNHTTQPLPVYYLLGTTPATASVLLTGHRWARYLLPKVEASCGKLCSEGVAQLNWQQGVSRLGSKG